MIIAVDVGLKRIGVAQYIEGIVAPIQPIFRKNRNQAARELDELLRQKGAQKLVVGIPQEGSSSEEMKRRILYFIGLLEFSGEICFVDEAFSSYEANQRMRGIHKNKRDGKVDSISALIILERFLLNLSEDSRTNYKKINGS